MVVSVSSELVSSCKFHFTRSATRAGRGAEISERGRSVRVGREGTEVHLVKDVESLRAQLNTMFLVVGHFKGLVYAHIGIGVGGAAQEVTRSRQARQRVVRECIGGRGIGK